MRTGRHFRHIDAPRNSVYCALLDARLVAQWNAPAGMRCEVHAFEAREGGSFRISLTNEAADAVGKTTVRTDTYQGRFTQLIENEKVVEVDEFETSNPAFQGEMTSVYTLADADGGTDLVAVHEGLPSGVAIEDNDLGWRMALDKLAALVEAHPRP